MIQKDGSGLKLQARRGRERQGMAVSKPVSQRPAEHERSFSSPAVEAFIREVAGTIEDPHIRWMFANCYPNTLDTTVQFEPSDAPDGGADTFVITGDIPAMWLRDSAAQVWPYLHLAPRDGSLARMVEGLIARHARCVITDPYANGFLREPASTNTHFGSDLTEMRPGVYERKWEVDSLAYVLRLSCGYWTVTGSIRPFDATWLQGVRLILDTFDVQRRPEAFDAYRFQRTTAQGSDTHPIRGRGNPGRPCGLIRSAFRCSDDASIFPYVIPSNLMAAAELERVAGLLANLAPAEEAMELASRARKMAREIRLSVQAYGVVEHPIHGRIYAYEVDGYGSALLMDDAGIPSLLSLPYLGAVPASDTIYQNTRRFALSHDNPFYFEGTAASGIGSPHTDYGSVWPMSLLARGLSTSDVDETWEMVRAVARIDAGTGFVHESLDPNDPTCFTRAWFSWVNGLFGELVCKAVGRPIYTTKA